MGLGDLQRPRLVALLPDEEPVCGAFLESGELVVAWDRWVHVFPDPHGHESVDWYAGEPVAAIERAARRGAAICRLLSGMTIELCVEVALVKASPVARAAAVETGTRSALPPIGGIMPIAMSDDGRTVLLLSHGELIVADLRHADIR